jgi:hypothetical protein
MSDEDPESEAQRFSALLCLLKAKVPELEEWRLQDNFGETDLRVLTLSEAWTLVTRHLFDADDHPIDIDRVWPWLLAVIEVALELCGLLFDDARDDDGVTVDVFAGSGIMCDVTRNVASLQVLLPWMGPVSLDCAHIEVNTHTTSRGYDVNDVDWSMSSRSFAPLGISPSMMVPPRRT